MKMYAILFSTSEGIRYGEVPTPALNQGEVLIRVAVAGLCGSDMHKFTAASLPEGYLGTQILGHEISGEVVRVGDRSLEHHMGKQVAINPIIHCGDCKYCNAGHYQFCTDGKSLGRDIDGGFAEYIAVPHQNIRHVCEGVPLEVAALADPLAVGVHCVNMGVEGFQEKQDLSMAIIGDGAIGLCCAYVAHNYGIGDVRVYGRHEANLEVAAGMGAQTFYADGKVSASLDTGFDIVIETVGRAQSQSLEQAVRMVGKHGRIVVAGVFDHGFIGDVYYRDLFWKEAALIGANSYGVQPDGQDEFDVALQMIAQDHKSLAPLITHRLPLSSMQEAVGLMRDKGIVRVIKIILQPEVKA